MEKINFAQFIDIYNKIVASQDLISSDIETILGEYHDKIDVSMRDTTDMYRELIIDIKDLHLDCGEGEWLKIRCPFQNVKVEIKIEGCVVNNHTHFECICHDNWNGTVKIFFMDSTINSSDKDGKFANDEGTFLYLSGLFSLFSLKVKQPDCMICITSNRDQAGLILNYSDLRVLMIDGSDEKGKTLISRISMCEIEKVYVALRTNDAVLSVINSYVKHLAISGDAQTNTDIRIVRSLDDEKEKSSKLGIVNSIYISEIGKIEIRGVKDINKLIIKEVRSGSIKECLFADKSKIIFDDFHPNIFTFSENDIRNSKFTKTLTTLDKISFNEVIWPEDDFVEVYDSKTPDSIESKIVKLESKASFYSNLKLCYHKKRDILQAEKFLILEQKTVLRILILKIRYYLKNLSIIKALGYYGDLLSICFNFLSSRIGTNWFIAAFWILVINMIASMAFLEKWVIGFDKNSLHISSDVVDLSVYLLNFLSTNAESLIKNSNYLPLKLFCLKVVNALLIYQLVVSFRKYSRKF